MGLAELGEGCGRGGVLQGVYQVQCRFRGGVRRRGLGHGAMVQKKFDGFGNALGACFWHIYSMAAVVLRRSAKVPSIDAMWRPGTVDSGVFVDKNPGAGWSQGRAVVIKGAIELRLC